MADDEEYDVFDAEVRIPKGEQLADSRKTKGMKRGFTPKSAGKGPKHVEILLKDEGNSQSAQEPEVIYVAEPVEASRTSESSMAAEVAAAILSGVIEGLIEAAKPHVAHLWNTRISPAMWAKLDDILPRRQASKGKHVRRAKATTTTLTAEEAAENEASPQDVVDAPIDPKITMTSEQFQRLFMTWLAREDAQQALWYAISNAHIEDRDGVALAWRHEFNELSPQQRTERVKEILSANPSIFEYLGRHLIDCAPLELGEAIGRRDET
jgi:hypothetical protein